MLENSISYTRGQNFHHGNRQSLPNMVIKSFQMPIGNGHWNQISSMGISAPLVVEIPLSYMAGDCPSLSFLLISNSPFYVGEGGGMKESGSVRINDMVHLFDDDIKYRWQVSESNESVFDDLDLSLVCPYLLKLSHLFHFRYLSHFW